MGRRVLWFGDAGASTGFARVTHSIGERLVKDYGHDVHVMAFNHRGDYYNTSLKLYRPNLHKSDDIWGISRVLELLGRVMPEIVVMLHDPHLLLQILLDNAYDPNKFLLQMSPIITYIPCDGTNLPPVWAEKLTEYTNVVTMSQWGQGQYPGSKLVYHGVDTDQFWPVKEKPITVTNGRVLKSKKDCKRAFGFDPDGFLVLRVDKNSGRKDYAASIKALAPVMQKYSDIQVHLHCSTKNDASGISMNPMFSRWPDIDRKRWFSPDQHNTFEGWPQPDLNALYNAADLFISTSRGEGFGLTLAEAAACGIPIIAQNVSAIPEVVGPGGLLIEPQRLLTVPSGEDVWLADIPAFSEAIERVYLSAGLRRDLGEAGREHIKKFSWDFATARFDEYIERLASGTEASKEPVGAGA